MNELITPILLLTGFSFITYGGFKLYIYLLYKKIDPEILQNQRQRFTVRLYGGGYSKEAKQSEWNAMKRKNESER